jgi:hypothetical protein
LIAALETAPAAAVARQMDLKAFHNEASDEKIRTAKLLRAACWHPEILTASISNAPAFTRSSQGRTNSQMDLIDANVLLDEIFQVMFITSTCLLFLFELRTEKWQMAIRFEACYLGYRKGYPSHLKTCCEF